MAESSVFYTIKVDEGDSLKKAVVDLLDLVHENDEMMFGEFGVNDDYAFEAEDDVSGCIAVMIERINKVLYITEKYGVGNVSLEIDGIEDFGTGSYNAFKILLGKERYIQQYPFEAESEYDDEDEDEYDVDSAAIDYEAAEELALQQLPSCAKISYDEYIKGSLIDPIDEDEIAEWEDDIVGIFDKYKIEYSI